MAALAVTPATRLAEVPPAMPSPAAPAESDVVQFQRALTAGVDVGAAEARRRGAAVAAGVPAGIHGPGAVTGPATGDIPPPTAGTVSVSNGAELARALATARPGQHIVLEDGVYSAPGGRFLLNAAGTATAPIVIRAESPLGATLKSPLELRGPDQIASGLVLDGAQVRIDGDRSRLTRSRVVDVEGIAILVAGGVDTRVDHNELTGIRGRGISIKPDPSDPDGLLRPRIDHNWLHDWSGRPGVNAHEPIQIGQCLAHSDVSVRAIVERNLLERVNCDPEAISIKSSDNIIRDNTLLDSRAALVNRHGERNLIEANWIEGARGIRVRDEDNRVVGNTILDSNGHGLRILAGNVDPNGTEKGYPPAVRTVLIGNDVDRLLIGDGFLGSNRAAQGTVIEGDQGASPVLTGMARDTVRLEARGTVAQAVRLAPEAVGPGAPATPGDAVTILPEPLAAGGPAAPGPSTPGERLLAGLERARRGEGGPALPPELIPDLAQLAALLLATSSSRLQPVEA